MRYNLYILILAGSALLASLIHWKAQNDLDEALHTYQREASSAAHVAARQVEHTFEAVYHGLRTIARLPGVRQIDPDGKNVNAGTYQTVQEIYNNLASSVSMSEVYIVPVALDPDPVDPLSTNPQEPILTFDQLILGRTATNQASTSPRAEVEEIEEIEIHEYRLMRNQLAHLREHFPTESDIEGLGYPAVSGPAVITCDNTRYSPQAPDDSHRSGLVYSVPFYGLDGALRGEISGVLLTEVLRDLVGAGYYALHSKAHAFVAGSQKEGPWREAAAHIAEDRTDDRLLYSEVMQLRINDVSTTWTLWAGQPDSMYWSRGDVRAAKRAAYLGYAGVAVLAIALSLAVRNQRHRQRLIEQQKHDLQAQVGALDSANTQARRLNTHLDRLIDSIPDALLVVDSSQRIVRSNPAARRLVGCEADGLNEMPLRNLLDQDLDTLLSHCSDTTSMTEAELHTKDGGRVPVHLSTSEMAADAGGNPDIIIIAQDITVAKLTERRRSMKYAITRLLANADSLDEVMPSILESITTSLGFTCASFWCWEPAQDLLLHKSAWGDGSAHIEDFLACQRTNDPETPGGLIRQAWNTGEFAWIDDVSGRSDFKRAPFAQRAQLRGGLAIPIWDGTTTFGVIEMFSRSIESPDGESAQDCQSIGSQIGQFCRRKQAETALLDNACRLEKKNQELDQFAYITSHDLKAPLRAIANLATWIEEDLGEHLTGEISENMQLLRGRVQRMEALIQGILDYSRIGREAIREESVDLAELLKEVIDSLPVPREFRININAQMPVVHASKVRLTQIFANLIGNAIKYHDRLDGQVSLTVARGTDWYEFSIEDDGPGIPEEFHEKVFGIFQTLEARDKVESTGIGLTLVKKIIEEQGGSIKIASHAGRGARFCFTWPLERQAA